MQRLAIIKATVLMALLAVPTLAEQRPTVGFEKCTDTYAIACKAPICLKVRTAGWDQFPPGMTEFPEVSIQFSRKIRAHDGQPMPGNRFKVALEPGRDHEETLWFQTDDGPLFLAFVDFTVRLKPPYSPTGFVSPDALPFDIAPARSEVSYRMSGDACRSYNGWFW